MALSKKEYSEMMKYLTRPATSSAQLGARAGFKEGTKFKEETKLSDYIKPNVYASTGSSDRGGVKVDNKTISAVINLNIPLTKKLKIISDINAGTSKTKVDLSELGKKYGVDLGTETYRDKNLNVGVGGEYTFDSGAKLKTMIDPANKSGQVSIGMPFQKGGRVGLKKGTDTLADVAVENSLFNPKTYGKYAKQIAKMTGADKLLGGLGSIAGVAAYETGLLSDAEKALSGTDYLGRESTIKGQSESGRSALDIATDPLNYVELPFMSAVSGIITNPTAQKLLNLGIPAKYIKTAGPAGLAAMGITSLIDLARKSQKEFDQLSPEKQAKYLREQEEFAESVNREQFGSDD